MTTPNERNVPVSTVGDDFPKQQARCRELIAQYKEIGNGPGVFVGFAIANIEAVLRRADEAAISGDIVAILKSYEEMKGCE